MFQFMAITQQTANWLLRKSDSLSLLSTNIVSIINMKDLRDSVAFLGPLRFSGSRDGKVLAVWNTEYLSGSGQEDWGIIGLDENSGLLSNNNITQEVFERCLHVIDLRLQGLLLEENLIHKKLDDNVHKCLAGRGDEGRQYSIGYYENNITVDTHKVQAIIISGPFRNLKELSKRTIDSKDILTPLLKSAEALVTGSPRKPVIDNQLFRSIEHGFQAIPTTHANEEDFENVPCLEAVSDCDFKYKSHELTYNEWVSSDSPLLDTQRRIIESDILLRQPLRIIGAAGSGKTLLMQLLAIKRLNEAKTANSPIKILYIVHNASMMENVWSRFINLGAEAYMEEDSLQQLQISTLFDISTGQLGLGSDTIIDKDAYETKLFQLITVKECLEVVLNKTKIDATKFPLLHQVFKNRDLIDVFSFLVTAEIGIAIKGHNLIGNKRKYIDSEQKLSRLHGLLTRDERNTIYDVFEEYHQKVFEEMQLLDSDDIAISFLGSLKTPLWQMKRKKDGYDYVFVDETQLFNENERRIFPLLSKGDKSHVPIVIALDESQELNGTISSGFGRLGIESIADENLYAVYRSTKSILELAFHVLQQTTDLFDSEFPDFTSKTVSIVPENHKLATKPYMIYSTDQGNLVKFIGRQIQSIRRQNIRQIAVIVHADRYWGDVSSGLKALRTDVVLLTRRGEKIDPDKPITVVARPESVGGQEFDAVIAIGLEQGLVPPTVDDHHGGLLVAFEQKALREMYLSFTRARYQLILINTQSSAPSSLLKSAITADLIDIRD